MHATRLILHDLTVLHKNVVFASTGYGTLHSVNEAPTNWNQTMKATAIIFNVASMDVNPVERMFWEPIDPNQSRFISVSSDTSQHTRGTVLSTASRWLWQEDTLKPDNEGYSDNIQIGRKLSGCFGTTGQRRTVNQV